MKQWFDRLKVKQACVERGQCRVWTARCTQVLFLGEPSHEDRCAVLSPEAPA